MACEIMPRDFTTFLRDSLSLSSRRLSYVKAALLKSDAEILNQPAIDAAMQFVFTPAMQHSGPVSVWVSIPFKFNLKGQ